jgi:diaminopimelate epimerase
MHFTKMQGIGNDYIYVNCFAETVNNAPELAIRLSDRHFGIGSDGLILIAPSDCADFQMIMYNADGSRAQMCGNGIRCVGKYVHDRGLTDQTRVTVETAAGVKTLELHLGADGQVETVTVDMGEPILEPARIPVAFDGERAIELPIEAAGQKWNATCVSMGNPHAVVFVEDTASLDLPTIGPAFEHHAMFPERTNTEFVQVCADNVLRMRVWERGSGETLACGTGACASLVAAALTGRCGREATLKLLGGDLAISWNGQNNHIFMTGPATFVFDGIVEA